MVERQHGHGVRAAHPRGERRDRRAEHVHPGVAAGHHHRRRHHVLHLRARGRRPAHLGDPRPQPAGRAQLGDGEELVGGGRVAELQLGGGLFDTQPGLGQLPQVGHAGGQRGAQFLRGRAARLVVRQRVHGQRAQARVPLGAADGQGGEGGEVQCGAGAGLVPERVAAQVAAGGLRVDALVVVQPQQRLGGGLGVAARVQGDRCQVEVDAVEGAAQLGDRDAALAQHQPQGGAAVLQVGEHGVGRAVGECRVPLPYVPAARAGALRAAAPHEGGEARQAGVGRAVARGVQGPGAQPVLQRRGQGVLRCRAGQFLARPAQDALDQALPLLMCRVRELGGQGEPVVRQDRHGSDARAGRRSQGGARAVRFLFLRW